MLSMKKDRNNPFNLLDKTNLGLSVVTPITEEPIQPVPPKKVEGIGVYAIYYQGAHSAYSIISKLNQEKPGSWPLYVGKAIAKGGRKGILGDVVSSFRLFNRLRKHAGTINEVDNLKLEDFSCRVLIVDPIWIPLGEQLMIDRYKPLWNTLLDGFGNNDPGSGRYKQQRSSWDTLHSGRSWAKN